MTSLVRKFGLVVAAALALALVPGSSFLGSSFLGSAWGQTKPAPSATGQTKPAPAAAGKTAPTGSTGQSAADAIKKSGQMTTEAGRRAALQEEQKAAEAKAKEAAAKSGKPAEEIKNTAPKTSGFIIEKGDPFAIPIKSAPTASAPQDLPPGQAGLMVSQIDLQGIVKMVGGNRAVVHGPHDRTYFLKVNDKVYNARVTKITDDTIYFEETSVDPMGKVMKRELTKSMPSDAKKP